MLLQTLRVTFDLLLLRRGPQDFPSSWHLLAGFVGGYVFLNAMVLSLGMSQAHAVLHAVAVTGMLALFTYLVLQRVRLLLRFAQTLTALLAVGVVLGLAALPCMIELQPFLEQLRVLEKDATPPPPPILAISGYMVISLWHLLAMAHIYRHALDTTLGRGVLLALLYEIVLLMTVRITAGLAGT